jgi:hypothetical protein
MWTDLAVRVLHARSATEFEDHLMSKESQPRAGSTARRT